MLARGGEWLAAGSKDTYPRCCFEDFGHQVSGSPKLAGEVEAVGAAVGEFAVGDHVFGATGLRFGAHAEFTCMRESARIAHKPSNMSFEQAAAVCDGALNALWCLRGADLRKGQRILIYGASGSIGTAGVQLAKHFETDVTAVCNTKNRELMRSLGATRVIDYTQEDFTKNGETYDFIFDPVGKHSFARCRGSLKPGGRYLATDGFRNLILALWTSRIGDKRVVFSDPTAIGKGRRPLPQAAHRGGGIPGGHRSVLPA
jgi:NADPH:quinone reductase-like Zn-dependent oxidoreductase